MPPAAAQVKEVSEAPVEVETTKADVGVKAVLLGPPGSGKGTQVRFHCSHDIYIWRCVITFAHRSNTRMRLVRDNYPHGPSLWIYFLVMQWLVIQVSFNTCLFFLVSETEGVLFRMSPGYGRSPSRRGAPRDQAWLRDQAGHRCGEIGQ